MPIQPCLHPFLPFIRMPVISIVKTPCFRPLTALVFALALGLFLSTPATAADKTTEALEGVHSRLSGIESVSAKFTQTRKLAAFAAPLEIKGSMALLKPAQFAWIVEEPIRYALVVKGENATEWDEESNLSRRTPLSRNMVMRTVVQQLQTWFSGDYRDMAKEFEISAAASPAESFIFRPKRRSPAAKFIRDIQVVFGGESGYIESIQIREDSGNQTSIKFSSIRLNKKIPKGVWNAAEPR